MFDFEARGLPVSLLVFVLIIVPCFIGLFFGLFAWRGIPPLSFHCNRCGADFTQKAWRRFPRACPTCRATDWHR